jgi:hypothetical protein
MGSGYRRIRLKKPTSAHASRGSAPPPGFAKDAYGRHGWSIALPSEQRQAERLASSRGACFFGLRLEAFLEFAGEFHKPRSKADILVQGVALIVARNDFRTPLVGHGGGDFIEAGTQKIGNDGFDRLPRKQCSQGMQTGCIVQIQSNRVFLRGAQRRRVFLPAIEQGLEFHDYSAIPDYKDMRIIDRGMGSNMYVAK